MKPKRNYANPENNYSFQEDDNVFMPKNTFKTFDYVSLALKLAKYWYLFLFVLILAAGLAYLKNKTWTPTYKAVTTILLEDNKKLGIESGLSSRTVSDQGLRGINNQMVMYSSYEFLMRAVNRMNLTNEVYSKGRFKNSILYGSTPIKIKASYIANDAYGKEFRIMGVTDQSYEIYFPGDDNTKEFKFSGKYGESLQNALFFIVVDKTDKFVKSDYELYFHFLSPSQQVLQLSSCLSYRFVKEDASIMEVSLIGKVAAKNVDFLNSLNTEFFEDNLARKNQAAERSIEFIDDQLSIIKDSIVSSESKLNIYQARAGVYTQDKSKYSNSLVDGLDQKRSEVRLKKDYMKLLSNYLNKENNNELLVSPSAISIQDPQLSMLVNKYNELLTEIGTLGEASPIYKRDKALLDDTRNSLKEAISSMNESVGLEENSLDQRYGKVMADISSLPQRERGLLTLERDFKINDAYYTYLLQKRTESQIQRAANVPDNLIIDQPRTVGVVNGTEGTSTYLFYISVGLFLVLLFVICKEFLFKFSVQSREEVEKISNFPIVGTIERISEKELVSTITHPQSNFAESLRSIRSRMNYLVKREGSTTLLLTSTEPKDGKTFIAMNLGFVYQQLSGKKTILVDLDLRRPALSKAMNMHKQSGVSNFLIGQVSLDEIIVTHPEYGFDFLPSGTTPPNPSELVCSNETVKLLDDLKKRYDYVILDCSPVGLISDAYVLSSQSDVVLYVVRSEKTNRNFFKYTVNELREDGINNVAIIFNDVNISKGSYYNHQHYGRTSYSQKYTSYYHDKPE